VLRLTPQGKELLDRIAPLAGEVNDESLGRLSWAERDQFATLVHKPAVAPQ
jgi:DNA-binding MarR family transcriptional regulator